MNEKLPFSLNLQYFSEPGGENQEPQTETETKTYTEDEVMKMLQAETDRRVSSALKKQQEKFKQQMTEAEKLRGMTEEQQKQYEFEQRVKEFEEKERHFKLMENKLECSKILSEKGLPAGFLEYVVAEDAEEMANRITNFEQMFKSAVADAVSAKIGSQAPKAGASATQTGMTKEQFRNLSIAQQSEIFRSNPELYKRMVNG